MCGRKVSQGKTTVRLVAMKICNEELEITEDTPHMNEDIPSKSEYVPIVDLSLYNSLNEFG